MTTRSSSAADASSSARSTTRCSPCPGSLGAAAAVRRSRAGNQLLVGYVAVDDDFDADARRWSACARADARRARAPSRRGGPTADPDLGQDRPRRAALAARRRPGRASAPAQLEGTAAWVAELWLEVVGAVVTDENDDFFDLGGGSLTAAQMVSRLRARYPEVTVGGPLRAPDASRTGDASSTRWRPRLRGRTGGCRPTPSKTQIGQIVFTVPLRVLSGLRWATWVAAGANIGSPPWDSTTSRLSRGGGCSSAGSRFVAAAGPDGARRRWAPASCCAGSSPGEYPRGGKIHLRLWLAERLADELGAAQPRRRRLDADVRPGPRCQGRPARSTCTRSRRSPGMLTLGSGCSIEPEVDLSGHWLDGDVLHVGPIKVGARALGSAPAARSCPGAVVGRDAEVAPGFGGDRQGRQGRVLDRRRPPSPSVATRGPWSDTRPPYKPRLGARRTPPSRP